MSATKHSAWFEKIKQYFDDGRWPEAWVKNAVVKKKITVEEFKEITGRAYKA